MKLKRLKVPSYPPLTDKDYSLKPGFNLLFGPNERGKSLTIDAIVKLLLGKRSNKFHQIDRVDEQPGKYGGFVELEFTSPEGEIKTKKFQGQEELPEYLGISADDCENIFFIRNSQLSIGKELQEERNFYTNLTDRLTGLKTQQISALKQELRAQAQITPSNDQFKSTGSNNYLGGRIDEAKKLLSEQGLLTKILSSSELSEHAQALKKKVGLKTQLTQLKKERQELEKARKRQNYQQIKSCLDTIKSCQDKLTKFKKFNEQDQNTWQKQQTKIEEREQRKQEVLDQIKTKEKELTEVKKTVKETQEELAGKKQKRELLTAQIQTELEQLKQEKSKIQAQASQLQLWTWLGLSSVVVLAASLLTLAFSSVFLAYITGGISLLAALLSFTQIIGHKLKQQKFEQRINKLRLDLKQQEIAAGGLSQMTASVQQTLNTYQKLEDKLSRAESEAEQIKKRIKELKNQELKTIKNKIKKNKKTIKEIKLKTQVESLKQYIKKLSEKEELNSKIKTEQAVLENKLGLSHQNLEKIISEAKKAIKKLAAFAEQAPKTNYDESRYQVIKQKQEKIESNIESLQQASSQFEKKLEELERKGQKILDNPEEAVRLQSPADLNHLQTRLKNFINKHQQKRALVLQAIDILEQIEQEDKQKISTLFGQNSPISDYFNQITDSKYQLVSFDQEDEVIAVSDQQGKSYTPDKLSAGTHDQLYFSIRMGLAEKILAQPGFFVMDDPFIKADQNRLKTQMDMLMKLVKTGWQILYFSAKEEVKQALETAEDYHLIEV